MKIAATLALAGALILVTSWTNAQWQPTLVPAPGEGRAPGADIRIRLPASVTVETLQYLALEIDDIDVSEVVEVEESPDGFVITVTPPQPLEPGSHRVRLVEYARDGRILERGNWAIETGSPTGFAEASLDARTSVDLGQRVEHDAAGTIGLPGEGNGDDSNASDSNRLDVTDDDDFQGDGSTAVSGRLAKDDWEVDAEASVLYSSLGVDLRDTIDDPRSGNEVDIGEYLVTRRDELSEINFGHHAIESDSLIMEEFYRRGVSATRSTDGGRATGTAFAMRTEPVIGSDDILGVEEVDSRVMGGVASVSPFSDPDALTLSATALGGRGNDDQGKSFSGRDVLAEGEAASISVESRLLDDKLRVRGEYAKTNYDFDGITGGIDKIDDDARMLLAELEPIRGRNLGGAPASLTLGAKYQQTGLFFRSIANSFLPSDKDLRRVYGDFRWGGFNLSLSAGAEHDNVDNAPDLGRLNTDRYRLYTSYSPPPGYDDQGNLETPWYGRPSFSAGLLYGRQEQTRIPEEFTGSRIDRRTRTARVAAGFYYPDWNWYAAHSVGFEEDLTLRSPDIRNEITDVGVNFAMGRRLNAGLQFQYNRIRESDGLVTRARLWGANLDAVLIPDTLTGRLSYSLSLDRTTDNSFSSDNGLLSFELDWQLVQPRENRPGVSVFLRGELQNFDDRLDAENDVAPSQVFLGVSVDWPVSLAREYSY